MRRLYPRREPLTRLRFAKPPSPTGGEGKVSGRDDLLFSRGRHGLPLAPCRTAPVLQRRPDAAREPKAIDRGRRTQRLEAMQLDAAPLEAAFLQDVARRRGGHARA